MKCPECQSAEMAASKENYRYLESGLSNVTLVDVQVRRCPKCGAHLVSIPKLAELHRAIAAALINKTARLAPAEVRFLRKYLGWSGADFAKKFHTRAEQVSRWESENSESRMSISNELLLRVLVAHGQKIEDYASHIEDIAVEDDVRSSVIAMQRTSGEWDQAA